MKNIKKINILETDDNGLSKELMDFVDNSFDSGLSTKEELKIINKVINENRFIYDFNFWVKVLRQRWETIICSEGESCWCRGIIIEGTYDRRAEVDENGNEINIVVGWGELPKTLVEHIVKIHNGYINSNNIPTPQPKGTYDNIEYGASVTYKLTKDEYGNKGLVEMTASKRVRENFKKIKENFNINEFEKWLIEYRNNKGK